MWDTELNGENIVLIYRSSPYLCWVFFLHKLGWCVFEVNFRIYYHLIECLTNCISKKNLKNIVPCDPIEQCKWSWVMSDVEYIHRKTLLLLGWNCGHILIKDKLLMAMALRLTETSTCVYIKGKKRKMTTHWITEVVRWDLFHCDWQLRGSN